SPDWIDAFDRIVRGHDGLRAASAERRLVLSYTVSDQPLRAPTAPDHAEAERGDAGERPDVRYAIVLDHGDNRVVAGPVDDPDVTFRTDRATAGAIAAHAESAQTAFMAGRLRLGGDVRALLANQDLLAGIDDCTASLRAADVPEPV